MTEGLLTWLLGGLAAACAGAAKWLIARVGELEARVRDLEVGGHQGVNALELKLTREFGAIRESLARIEMRLGHLESGSDERDQRHSRGGPGG